MVIEDTAASIWPDCTAANRPWKGMLTISTVLPSRLPISFTRSISKPTNLPLRVLELPRHVADVGAHLQVGRPGEAGAAGEQQDRRHEGAAVQANPLHVVFLPRPRRALVSASAAPLAERARTVASASTLGGGLQASSPSSAKPRNGTGSPSRTSVLSSATSIRPCASTHRGQDARALALDPAGEEAAVRRGLERGAQILAPAGRLAQAEAGRQRDAAGPVHVAPPGGAARAGRRGGSRPWSRPGCPAGRRTGAADPAEAERAAGLHRDLPEVEPAERRHAA